VPGQFVNTNAACDLSGDGVVNVVDIQVEMSAALGGTYTTMPWLK
jgi:hypothetical protein